MLTPLLLGQQSAVTAYYEHQMLIRHAL